MVHSPRFEFFQLRQASLRRLVAPGAFALRGLPGRRSLRGRLLADRQGAVPAAQGGCGCPRSGVATPNRGARGVAKVDGDGQ